MKGACGLVLASMAVCAPAWGQMYKCVDANGVTHYADSPRPGCRGREVDIRPIPPVSGEVQRPEENFAQQDADFKRRQSERAAHEAQERSALAARCKSLRQQHAALSSGRRLARTDERGERVYVPDEVREQQLARLREAMRACP